MVVFANDGRYQPTSVPHAFAFGDRSEAKTLGFGAPLEALRLEFVSLASELDGVLTVYACMKQTDPKQHIQTKSVTKGMVCGVGSQMDKIERYCLQLQNQPKLVGRHSTIAETNMLESTRKQKII
jgi:hypothetical protein